MQKSLRRIFDREGIRIRLHGAYVLTLDDAFDDIADDDTAEGLISDRIVTPHVKRMLIRNVALLEQLCCSDEGSARDYHGGEVLREGDQRPAAQLALAFGIFFLVQFPLSILWLRRFRWGPLEYAWRVATYGRSQPKQAAAPAA